jgi:DNA-binding beta-propeller fold protein YncE
MMRTSILTALLVSGALSACNSETASSEHAPKPSAAAVLRYSGFSGPERVLYDGARDRYLVSNVNGEPAAKDGNGFISVLSPDGGVTELEWIGGGESAALDAPKGLALVGDVLYVADIGVIRRFDANTGAALGALAVPGSTFLNGLSATADGRLYVSDSGPPQGTLDAVGTEAVYVVDGDHVHALASGPLGRPTSLAAVEEGVLVASFGGNQVYELDAAGHKRAESTLPAGGLAGVVKLGDWAYVTSWQASSIYAGKLGESFEVVLSDLASPTDLGHDTQRNRLLVPHFTEDSVEVFAFE